jgi:hypothetical protein
MSRSAKHQERALRGELSRNLSLFFFDNREINNILDEIALLGEEPSRKAMALCVAFSNMSGSIVPKVLGHIKAAFLILKGEDLTVWLSKAFDLLDSGGLEASKRFLEATSSDNLESFLKPKSLGLVSVSHRIETFLRAVSGSDIQVLPSASGDCYTDTGNAYFPSELSTFRFSEENQLFYKVLSAHLWGHLEFGTFLISRSPYTFENFFSQFNDKNLALDIYRITEASRIETILNKKLAGLMRDANILKKRLLSCLPHPQQSNDRASFMDRLYREFI